MEKKSLLRPSGQTSNNFLSVEPALFFFIVGLTISERIFENFLLFKTCKEPNYADSKCDTELDSETATSRLQMYITAGCAPVAILTTSFAGSLIDRNVKFLRWFLLQPVVFQLMFDAISFVCASQFDCSPIFLTIYSILLRGIGGIYVAAMLFSVTYVSHASTDDTRLVRIGRVLFASCLAQSVGSLIAGYVVEWFGFSRGFLICVGLGFVSLLSNLIFVEDFSKSGIFVDEDKSAADNKMGSFTGGLKILLRKRKHNKRKILILLTLVNIFYQSILSGKSSVIYLFLRNKFGWEAAQYGVFTFYLLCVEGLGTLIATEIFKRRFHLPDTTNAIIASCSFIVYMAWYSIMFESWQVYLAPILGIFRSGINLVSLSMASKCVERAEYGRLSSLNAVLNICLPVAVLASSVVYQWTLRVYPAAVFLCFIPPSVGILVIYCSLVAYMKKLPSNV